MKRLLLAACLSGVPLLAGVVPVGSIGVELGVPSSGQDDIAIFNATGSTYGCSAMSGTPVCTPVTFDNVQVTLNGSNVVSLGDIAPGSTDSYSINGTAFADGTVTSVSFAATLSNTALILDGTGLVNVDSGISVANVPLDGINSAEIDANPVSLTATPEPDLIWPALVCFFLLCLAASRRASIRPLSR